MSIIKYSFLIPYFNRAGQFHNTLVSLAHHYFNRSDYEVIISEDQKNVVDEKAHKELMGIVDFFKNKINIKVIEIDIHTWNPCIAFNRAAAASVGEYVIVTNPECFHQVNVLGGLDKEFENNPDSYVLCGCQTRKDCNLFIEKFEDLGGEEGIWFQHSVHRNAGFHFFGALSRKKWDSVGGFDEDFVHGTSFEDADFRNRIRRVNIPFILRDDLLTIHINHSNLWVDPKLEEINRKTFQSKWD